MAKACIYGTQIAAACPVRAEFPSIGLSELVEACEACPLKALHMHDEIIKRVQRMPPPQQVMPQQQWQR